jgi:hypothetical protein
VGVDIRVPSNVDNLPSSLMITSRDFRRPAHHEFYKTLVEASPSGAHPFYRLFEHFLTMSSTALAQGVSKFATGKIDDELEAEYMRTVKHYDREKAQKFAHAQAILVNSLHEELHDFLGDVFSCSEISNHWNGQFFTPWPICRMMAKMNLVDAMPSSRRFTVCEPAVGGGAMLLAVAVELKEAGYNPWHWWFEATDNDLRCFQMAYIQLSLAGAAGVVRHGNSLTNQVWKVWPTLTGVMFPHRWPKADEKKIIELPPATKPGDQMHFNLAA